MTGSWELMATWPGGTVASMSAAENADGSTLVYAATPLGLFCSRDSGRSWEKLPTGFAQPSVEIVATSPNFREDETVLAGSITGLYVSTDAGRTWRQRLRGGPITAIAVSPDFATDQQVFVGTGADGALRSDDAGRSWSSVNPGLLDLSIYALALSPEFGRDQTGFLATGSGLYRTRNGGSSWREVETGYDEPVVQCLAVSPNYGQDRLVLAGTDGDGLLCSDNGGTSWTVPSALAERSVTAVAFSPNSQVMVVATDEGLFSSQDSGGTWRSSGDDLEPVLSLTFPREDTTDVLLAGQYHAGVARSDDGGTSWAPSNDGLNANLLADLCVSGTSSGDQTLLVVDLEAGVLKSDDEGVTWVECSNGLEGVTVLALATSPRVNGTQTIYAATTAGIFRSVDGADDWAPVLTTEVPILAVATSPVPSGDHDSVVAVSKAGDVYSSEDGGHTWQTRTPIEVTPETVTIALTPDYARDSTIFVGTGESRRGQRGHDLALWRSTDGGTRWTRLLTEEGQSILPLAVSTAYSTDSTIFVGAGNRVLRVETGVNTDERTAERTEVKIDTIHLESGATAITSLAVSPSKESRPLLLASTDAGIFGGTQNGVMASLIWIPTDYVRFMLNYARLDYDGAALPAAGGNRDYGVNVVGARAQIDF
jgi:photosystem II stability/assembly factor-like uncharacterized protein